MSSKQDKSVVFAALLHDIGKLIQRSEQKGGNHSTIGADYINNTKNELLKTKEIVNPIKYHHWKQLENAEITENDISYIIYEADNIAAGSDRRKTDTENEGNQGWNKTACLSSVFNMIRENTDYSYLLRDFDNKEEPNYPVSLNENDIKATQGRYSELKNHIDKNINSIESPNSLLQLFEATMSFIPSSTKADEICDISLYDHSKLTAAIASCMYQYFEENGINNYKKYCFNESEIESNRQIKYYKLVSLNISGIQDFIYTISSENALKSLRGRSFYLEFLIEHIADELLEKLNLSKANLLYSGGGMMYLLLPNTKQVEIEINALVENINDWFIEKFSTSLYMSIGQRECSSSELMKKSNEVFKEVSKNLSRNKINRYSKEQLEELFDIENKRLEIKNDEKECKICRNSDELEEGNICKLCSSLIELGRYLTGKDDLIIYVSKKDSKYAVEIPTLSGEKIYLNIKEKDEKTNEIIKSEDCIRVYTINKWYTGNEKYISNLWLGNYSCGKSVDFKELSESCKGIKRIGILRADVDNLGSTFATGIKKEYTSISRIATLSRQLSMFFKYYINYLAKDLKIVIIYSGGDDIFIAGGWSDVIKFAQKIRTAFKKYTCDKLTFSCGIGFYTPTYPISKMAELTGVLEDYAKTNEGKNSIALFGEGTNIKKEITETTKFVFSWEKFNKIEEYLTQIKEYCYFDEDEGENNKLYISASMIYRLMNLITTEDYINIARLAYSLARFEPKSTGLMKNYNYFRDLVYNLYKTDKLTLLTILNLIVYENRKG